MSKTFDKVRISEQEAVNTKRRTKIIHEGQYIAEVDVDLIESDAGVGWSPYLSLEDAHKLEDVREALQQGDIKSALRLARVLTLTSVTE